MARTTTKRGTRTSTKSKTWKRATATTGATKRGITARGKARARG